MAEGRRHLTKLNHVQAALTTLHLRNEALSLSQSLCQLDLSDTCRIPRRGDEADQLLMPLRENR